MTAHSRIPRLVFAYLVAASALVSGCAEPSDQPAPTKPTTPTPFAGQTLHVAVIPYRAGQNEVADQQIAQAIFNLAGQWSGETGGKLVVELKTAEEDAITNDPATLPPDTDVIIIHPARLGGFAAANALAEFTDDRLESDAVDWPDLFALLKDDLAAWNRRTYALPLGSPPLHLIYRPDVIQTPPATWEEYDALVQKLADSAPANVPEDATWSPALEPLENDFAALTLLARAAAYARHPDNYSTLFRVDDFEPLIDSPPFVRALEDLVRVAQRSNHPLIEMNPEDCAAAFFRGESAFAISMGWDDPGIAALPDDAVRVAELPGSQRVYDVSAETWDQRRPDASPHVTLLYSGRLVAVTATTDSPDAAFQFASRLAGASWASQLASATTATTLSRRSQVGAPSSWAPASMPPDLAAAYAQVVSDAMNRRQSLLALRIPDRDKYLAALAAAVHRAVSGDVEPSDALADAADTWREITAQRGLAEQHRAYRQSLGLPTD